MSRKSGLPSICHPSRLAEVRDAKASRSSHLRMTASPLYRQRQLHQVLGDDDPAGKILLHVLGPVVVGDEWIVAGDEMAERQHLHAGGGGDAADVLGGGMALEQMFLQRRAVLGLDHEAVDRGHVETFTHQYVGAFGKLRKFWIVGGGAGEHD